MSEIYTALILLSPVLYFWVGYEICRYAEMRKPHLKSDSGWLFGKWVVITVWPMLMLVATGIIVYRAVSAGK